MSEIDAEVKKWGNTLGIRVPAALARAEGIQAGDRVHVTIERAAAPNPAFFGMGRRLPRVSPAAYYKARRDERRRDAAAWDRKSGEG